MQNESNIYTINNAAPYSSVEAIGATTSETHDLQFGQRYPHIVDNPSPSVSSIESTNQEYVLEQKESADQTTDENEMPRCPNYFATIATTLSRNINMQNSNVYTINKDLPPSYAEATGASVSETHDLQDQRYPHMVANPSPSAPPTQWANQEYALAESQSRDVLVIRRTEGTREPNLVLECSLHDKRVKYICLGVFAVIVIAIYFAVAG